MQFWTYLLTFCLWDCVKWLTICSRASAKDLLQAHGELLEFPVSHILVTLYPLSPPRAPPRSVPLHPLWEWRQQLRSTNRTFCQCTCQKCHPSYCTCAVIVQWHFPFVYSISVAVTHLLMLFYGFWITSHQESLSTARFWRYSSMLYLSIHRISFDITFFDLSMVCINIVLIYNFSFSLTR